MHRCECSICNVTKMLHDLEWPSLQQRCQQTWLIVMYKIFSQLIEIDSSNTRFYNSQTIQPSCNNCVVFANMFFPQTICNWNLLPTDSSSYETMASFNSYVKSHVDA